MTEEGPTSAGYEVVHVDELEELSINNPNGAFVLRPVRRRFGSRRSAPTRTPAMPDSA